MQMKSSIVVDMAIEHDISAIEHPTMIKPYLKEGIITKIYSSSF